MNAPDSLPVLLAIAAVFTLGGFVKGVVGLGLPTIAMGLLSILMLPAQAAALLVVPSLVTNLWQIFGPGFYALVRRIATMLLGVCVGTWIGSGWLSGTASAWASGCLGVALVVYALLGLLKWRPRVPPAHEVWLGPLVGVATGLVTAATGVFVIPAVPYLQALGMEKDDLVRALGISFMASTIALGVALGSHGALQGGMLLTSALALVPAIAGMAIGQWLRGRFRPETFRTVFFCGLLMLGVYLALRAAMH